MAQRRGTDIGGLCAEWRWKRARLVLELRRAAGSRGLVLPEDDSLRRMIRLWNRGERGLSELYAELLAAVFGVPFAVGKADVGTSGGLPGAPAGRWAGASGGPGHDQSAGPGLALPHPAVASGGAPCGRAPVPPGRLAALLDEAGGRSLAWWGGVGPPAGPDGEVLSVAIDRRQVLAGSVVVPAVALEQTRHDLLASLAADRAAAGADEWQQIGWEYGLAYLSTPPAELLASLQVDLAVLGAALRRQPAGTARRELRRVAALLAVFAAYTVANLGDLPSARRWWRSAKQAADACGDMQTRLWVRGEEVVRALYEQRPAPAILGLVAEAEAVGAGGAAPPAGLPSLLAGRAQVFALAGRAAAAEAALAALRDNLDRLPAHVTRDTESCFGSSERDVHFTESYVYSYLGDYVQAGRAQVAALALYPPTNLRGPVMVELQRALCLVRAGDVAPGVEHAHAAMAGLPREQHIRPIVDLGGTVLAAVPAAERERDGVRAFRSYLAGHEAA